MKAIFLDANVVVDYLDVASKDHQTAKRCLHIVRAYYQKPFVSPLTFLITNFLLGKLMKDKAKHRQRMQTVFAGFQFTPLNSSAIETVFKSDFLDLEDGVQYQCAVSVKAAAIITKNVHDFFPSKTPVIHPSTFINGYNKLIQ